MPRVLRSAESPRALLVAGAGLFIVSSLFPVAASLLRVDRLPTWVGVADVALAACLVVSGMVIVSKKPSAFAPLVVATAFRLYRALSGTFLVLLVVFFVLGDRLRWDILLPGLAWRAWVLVIVAPSWVTLWHAQPQSVEGVGGRMTTGGGLDVAAAARTYGASGRDLVFRLVRAGLLTGVIDGLFSSVLNVVAYRSTVSRLFQGVASVRWGPEVLNGGTPAAALGVLSKDMVAGRSLAARPRHGVGREARVRPR